MAYVQWIHDQDGNHYFACGQTVPRLPPGYYTLSVDSKNRLLFCRATYRPSDQLAANGAGHYM
jgi:hypothetical protein